MARLFFLVPDLKMTKDIAHDLAKAGIKESDIHVLGGGMMALKKAHLHQANLLQTSDLVPSLKRGAMIGIVFSLILSIIYAMTLPQDVKVNFTFIVAIFFFGTILCAWVSSLIGVSVPDPIVLKFKKYIKDGHYMMIVDSSVEKEKELSSMIISHHPAVKIID